jgi:hypothetical protein
MIRFITAGIVAALMAGAASLSAHENYRIIGTVTKVTSTKLDVKRTKDGKTISMFMDKTTRVTRDKRKVSASEIKTGSSVVVDAHGDTMDDLDVVEVRLVPAPAKK